MACMHSATEPLFEPVDYRPVVGVAIALFVADLIDSVPAFQVVEHARIADVPEERGAHDPRWIPVQVP